MATAGRYEAQGLEAQFEPGSRGRVLRNRLGIRSARQMAQQESEALLVATQRLIDEIRVDQRFAANDIRRMHRVWLGEIYQWVGEYRSVNVSKSGFMFAAAGLVPALMEGLERGALAQFTPCRFDNEVEQARALATVHTELVLIHPFREGNGRCARLLATLMGLQAGLPPLDFGGIRGRARQRYIAAVHAGLDRNYVPMTEIFLAVIRRTRRVQARLSSA
jgi:cell filamentation protein